MIPRVKNPQSSDPHHLSVIVYNNDKIFSDKNDRIFISSLPIGIHLLICVNIMGKSSEVKPVVSLIRNTILEDGTRLRISLINQIG